MGHLGTARHAGPARRLRFAHRSPAVRPSWATGQLQWSPRASAGSARRPASEVGRHPADRRTSRAPGWTLEFAFSSITRCRSTSVHVWIASQELKTSSTRSVGPRRPTHPRRRHPPLHRSSPGRGPCSGMRTGPVPDRLGDLALSSRSSHQTRIRATKCASEREGAMGGETGRTASRSRPRSSARRMRFSSGRRRSAVLAAWMCAGGMPAASSRSV